MPGLRPYRFVAVGLSVVSGTVLETCQSTAVLCTIGILNQSCSGYVDPAHDARVEAALTATVSADGLATLRWTSPHPTARYRVRRERRALGSARVTPAAYDVLPERPTPDADDRPARGATYTYFLDAYAHGLNAGPPPNSNVVTVDVPAEGPPVIVGSGTPTPTPTPAPTPASSVRKVEGLTVDRQTDGSVSLNWGAVGDADGYVSETRRADETTWTQIGRSFGPFTTSATHQSPQPGVRHHYRVAAYRGDAQGPYSDEASLAYDCPATCSRATAAASAAASSRRARIRVTGLRLDDPTSATVAGSTLRSNGLLAAGRFRLTPGSATTPAVRRALRRLARGTITARLDGVVTRPAAPAVRVSMTGPALLRGSGADAPRLCVRLVTRSTLGRTTGTATVLGGTGAAARLRGTVRLTGPAAGPAVGDVRLRLADRARAVPAACRALG